MTIIRTIVVLVNGITLTFDSTNKITSKSFIESILKTEFNVSYDNRDLIPFISSFELNKAQRDEDELLYNEDGQFKATSNLYYKDNQKIN